MKLLFLVFLVLLLLTFLFKLDCMLWSMAQVSDVTQGLFVRFLLHVLCVVPFYVHTCTQTLKLKKDSDLSLNI